MSWKKIPDEVLIELAEAATEEDKIPLTEFEIFMLDVGAGPGDDWVDAQYIYWRYLDWCLEKNIKPKSRYRFSHGINKKYKRIFDQGTVYYVMNNKPFQLENNEHWGMRRDWRLEREYKPWHKKTIKTAKAAGKSHRRRAKERKRQQKEALKKNQD